MWNLSLTLLCSQHQDRLPGCHWQKSPASSQSQLIQSPCSGLFLILMLCPSGWRLSSLLSSEAQWSQAWSELWRFLSVISINKSDSEARRLANRLPLICLSYFTFYFYFFLHLAYLITRAYFCLCGNFYFQSSICFSKKMQGYYWIENENEFCKMNHSLLYRTLFYQRKTESPTLSHWQSMHKNVQIGSKRVFRDPDIQQKCDFESPLISRKWENCSYVITQMITDCTDFFSRTLSSRCLGMFAVLRWKLMLFVGIFEIGFFLKIKMTKGFLCSCFLLIDACKCLGL